MHKQKKSLKDPAINFPILKSKTSNHLVASNKKNSRTPKRKISSTNKPSSNTSKKI